MWRQCVNTAVLCDTIISLLVAVHYSILANKHTLTLNCAFMPTDTLEKCNLKHCFLLAV